ncbi:hypothetical protein [Pseudarthrobacter sp. S9]|uniref:hypothetical protein n=1 Tax=Pseudarthrobacter sp. S9 TaxID=3418421 RepID=UPI003D08BB40
MSEQSYILDLVRRALDAADQPGTSVSSLVRQTTRIASLRRDYAVVLACHLETFDGGATHKAKRDTTMDEKLRTLLGDVEANTVIEGCAARYVHNRSMGGGKDVINTNSIDSLERLIDKLRTAAGDPAAAQYLTQVDAYFYLEKLAKAGAALQPEIFSLENIISRVRQRLHDYLVAAESEILTGQTESTLFTRGEAYVVERLKTISPNALEKYRAAEQRISEGTSEGFAQALASCRRMIKSLADSLYPATNKKIKGLDGKERDLGNEQFLNRLMQFAIDRLGRNTHVRLVEEAVEGLGHRLNKLNSLSSKGVHDEVSLVEAESCLMWTFFLVADLLRIEDGSIGLLSDHQNAPSA